MIPDAGNFLLTLAAVFAFLQAISGVIARVAPLQRLAALFGFLCLTSAVGCLQYAYITSDFSVVNVVENSHTLKPLFYKISGMWSNHEGSLLLWVWMLGLFSCLLARIQNSELQDTLRAARGVQGFALFGFLLFLIVTSNPFIRVFPPAEEGLGMNPLLQDVGLAIHPPLLYLGYTGFSVVFSLSVGALLTRNAAPAWVRLARLWTLISWAFLTIGIMLGSWWAYRELGWGGWWFWDPVENASLLPWLSGAALLHVMMVVEKRDMLRLWGVMLGIITFALALLGTFLVRSGLLVSVHSFASDPARGLFILGYITLLIGGALALFSLRAGAIASPQTPRLLTREGGMLVNSVILVSACATIALGTLYPIFASQILQQPIAVGGPYYAATFYPIMAPALFFAGLLLAVPWGGAPAAFVARRLAPAIIATFAACVVALAVIYPVPVTTMLGLAFGVWAACTAIFEACRGIKNRTPLPRFGGAIAHFGLGLFVIAACLNHQGRVDWQGIIHQGKTVETPVGAVTLIESTGRRGENYLALHARIEIKRPERTLVLEPEIRRYVAQDTTTSEVDYNSTPLRDVMAVVSKPEATAKDYQIRVYVMPWVNMLWLSAMLMAAGALISAFGLRRRKGIN